MATPCYVVLLYHGGESRYAPDLPPGVERVSGFLSPGDAAHWLEEHAAPSVPAVIAPADWAINGMSARLAQSERETQLALRLVQEGNRQIDAMAGAIEDLHRQVVELTGGADAAHGRRVLAALGATLGMSTEALESGQLDRIVEAAQTIAGSFELNAHGNPEGPHCRCFKCVLRRSIKWLLPSSVRVKQLAKRAARVAAVEARK